MATGLLAATVAMLLPAPAAAQLNRAEQKCVTTADKNVGTLIKTQEKILAACVKDNARGKLEGTMDECAAADPRGKRSKTLAKLVRDYAGCTDAPDFSWADAAAATNGGVCETQAHGDDLFGTPLDGTLATDRPTAKCQGTVLKMAGKLLNGTAKELRKCRKKKIGVVSSGPELVAACYDNLRSSKTVTKSASKIGIVRAKRCEGIDSGVAFPGSCSGLSGTAFDDCVAAAVICRACQAFRRSDGLNVDCDRVDDGQTNGSCSAAEECVRYAFVTRTERSVAQIGSVSGADAACLAEAASAGLPAEAGDWVAWLSDSGTNAVDRLTGKGKFLRTDGLLIATDVTDLTDGELVTPISANADGSVPPNSSLVYTGTENDGTAASNNCNEWTENVGFATVGLSDSTTDWTTVGGVAPCNASRTLYCFIS